MVRQEEGRLWSYREGDDAAMENPIVAWLMERRAMEVGLVTELFSYLKGRQTVPDFLLGAY